MPSRRGFFFSDENFAVSGRNFWIFLDEKFQAGQEFLRDEASSISRFWLSTSKLQKKKRNPYHFKIVKRKGTCQVERNLSSGTELFNEIEKRLAGDLNRKAPRE